DLAIGNAAEVRAKHAPDGTENLFDSVEPDAADQMDVHAASLRLAVMRVMQDAITGAGCRAPAQARATPPAPYGCVARGARACRRPRWRAPATAGGPGCRGLPGSGRSRG